MCVCVCGEREWIICSFDAQFRTDLNSSLKLSMQDGILSNFQDKLNKKKRRKEGKEGGREGEGGRRRRGRGGRKEGPSHSSVREKGGHSLRLQNLGCGGGVPHHKIHGDLEERCLAERGLGVSFLRLWPGERLSPRWPFREPRSLLLCWSHGAVWGEGRRRSAGE